MWARSSGTREMLVVIGVGVAGLALAVLAALAPWPVDSGPYPHAVRLDVPAATAPRG